MIGIIGIILALATLIILAYRGVSVLIASPIAAVIAILFAYFDHQPAHFLAEYTRTYMIGAAGFLQKYFPVFLFGAIFGKIMDVSGAAKSIAHSVTKALGAKRTVLAVVLSCAILTYGGVSLFVVVFAVYPIAAAMFRENDVPKRFIPGAIALGALTFTMTAMPGTPQIQNVIPASFFETDVFAAPILGLTAAVIMFGLGMLYLNTRVSKAKARGETYGEIDETHDSKANIDYEKLPSTFLAFLPAILVIVLNFIFSKYVFVAGSTGFDYTYLEGYQTTISKEGGNWAVLASLITVILLSFGFYRQNLIGKIREAVNQGANGAMTAIMNTAVVVGFGSVIKNTAGFVVVKALLAGIPGSPLISFALATTAIAGVTGSASGGLGIALGTLGEQYKQLAIDQGINMEILHRIAAVASGGLDSLPHCGAVITLLLVCGLNHKKSYSDVAVVSIIIPLIALVVIIIMGSMGIA